MKKMGTAAVTGSAHAKWMTTGAIWFLYGSLIALAARTWPPCAWRYFLSASEYDTIAAAKSAIGPIVQRAAGIT